MSKLALKIEIAENAWHEAEQLQEAILRLSTNEHAAFVNDGQCLNA